jgi:hypothetical protein
MLQPVRNSIELALESWSNNKRTNIYKNQVSYCIDCKESPIIEDRALHSIISDSDDHGADHEHGQADPIQMHPLFPAEGFIDETGGEALAL